jgi:hypothetical protein
MDPQMSQLEEIAAYFSRNGYKFDMKDIPQARESVQLAIALFREGTSVIPPNQETLARTASAINTIIIAVCIYDHIFAEFATLALAETAVKAADEAISTPNADRCRAMFTLALHTSIAAQATASTVDSAIHSKKAAHQAAAASAAMLRAKFAVDMMGG